MNLYYGKTTKERFGNENKVAEKVEELNIEINQSFIEK